MKAINSFLTGVAKEQTTQFLIDNGMVTPNDKGNVTLSAMRRALKELDDNALTDLANSFGFSEQENQVDAVIDSLGFSKDEIGKFTTSKGVDVPVINAKFKALSSGMNPSFEFSKGTIIVSSNAMRKLAERDILVKDETYPIKMDSIKPLQGRPGYFLAQALEAGIPEIQEIYKEKQREISALKDFKDRMRKIAGASEEEIKASVTDTLKDAFKNALG